MADSSGTPIDVITEPSEFNVKNFDSGTFDSKYNCGFPKYSYSSNSEGDLAIASQDRTLDAGGIQPSDGKYVTAETDRSTFYIDVKESENDNLYVILKQIDDKIEKQIKDSKKNIDEYPLKCKEDNKTYSFLKQDKFSKQIEMNTKEKKGKKITNVDKILEYTPLVRTPQNGEGRRIKVKLDSAKKPILDNDGNKTKNYKIESFRTELYLDDNVECEKTETIDDYRNLFSYKCKFSCVVRLGRTWYIPSSGKWGFSIFIDQIVVESNSINASATKNVALKHGNIFSKNSFVNKKEKGDDNINSKSKKIENNKKEDEKKKDEEHDKEDEDDDEDDDDDDDEDDDEDDDGEEDEDEDDDEDDEDDEDDDDEEEEQEEEKEEEKPAKKGKSKKA